MPFLMKCGVLYAAPTGQYIQQYILWCAMSRRQSDSLLWSYSAFRYLLHTIYWRQRSSIFDLPTQRRLQRQRTSYGGIATGRLFCKERWQILWGLIEVLTFIMKAVRQSISLWRSWRRLPPCTTSLLLICWTNITLFSIGTKGDKSKSGVSLCV